MSKLARIRYTWTRSPSSDVTKIVTKLKVNGNESTAEFGPDVQELMADVSASSSIEFQVDSYDAEGNVASSEVYTHTLGDLESPLPATNLFHEIVAVLDAPDGPADPL